MAPIQSTAHMNMASCPSPVRAEGTHSQFPAGLRVLVVDDDPTCLKILEKMLCKCLYEVTTCCLARVALSMLREKKGSFDLVISDVYMPDMDGFKLLEHVGLEMDLPVIMMSADGETSVVMKGIKHGACDYLIKPVRMEELQNIWQHVIRKKRNEAKELEFSGSADDSERLRKGLDDGDYASSVNEGVDWKLSKKRKEPKEEEDDGNQESDDPSSLKKPRVVWSVELHQQFVSAVNQLGIDKAVPKRILEMMNVQGLTRENIASHLQKYRLYLKRLSGVSHQQGGMNSSFAVSTETNFGSMDSLGRFDLHALVASGQISPQTLVAVQAGFPARANSNKGSGMPEEALLLQAALQGVNGNPSNRLTIGQSLMKSQGNVLQSLPGGIERNPFSQIQQNMPSFGDVGPSMDESSGFCMLQQQLTTADLGTGGLGRICGINKNEPLNPPNNVLMMQLRQQQQQWQPHQQQQQLQLQKCAPLEGAQLQGGHVHNLSSANFLGPQVLSDDIGGATMSLSTITNCSTGLGNSVIDAYGPIQGNCISPAACELTTPVSSAPVGIGRRLCIDYKNNDVPARLGNNFSLSSTVGSSALLTSIGTEAETQMPVLQSISGMSDISRTLEDSSFNFCAFNGLGQSTSQNGRQGWQVQNTSHSLDLSQTISPILNQGYSKAASGFQGLNVPHRQDQGQVRSLGFVGRGLGLPARFASDAGHHRAISNVHFQGDQTMADNALRVKGEDALELMGYSKIGTGLFSEQFPPSYEIMDLLFKQERLGLAEGGDFGVDGHQLNNIHVK